MLNPFEDLGVTFANPWWLLLLLAIPLLSWLKGGRGAAPSLVYSSTAIVRSLGRAVESRKGSHLASLFFAGLALLILAQARPQAGRTLTKVQASGIDIMLVLDVSKSMLAEDFHVGGERSNRLEAIKEVTRRFIEERPNDRIGMTAFAGRPYLVSPLTLDHDWLLQNLDRVKIGLVEDGTAIGSAVASASSRIKDKAAKSRAMILLTDGDNNAGKITPDTAAEAAKALGIKIYTIGAGSNAPAPFPVGKDVFGRTVYREVKFPLDEAQLKRIAETTGAAYYRATDTKSLESIFEQIDKLEKTTIETKQFRDYRDLFPWFTAVGLGLIVVQTALAQTVWRRVP